MDAMESGDEDALANLPENLFKIGTAEIKNWYPVIVGDERRRPQYHQVDYVPCYRSEAGTGNAMCFAYWDRSPAEAGSRSTQIMDDTVARLARLDACAVSDALDKLGSSPGAGHRASIAHDRPPHLRPCHHREARTRRWPAGGIASPGTTAIEAAQPGDVIVARAAHRHRRGRAGAATCHSAASCAVSPASSSTVPHATWTRRAATTSRSSRATITARTARGRIVETGTNVPITVGDVHGLARRLRGRRRQRRRLRPGGRH